MRGIPEGSEAARRAVATGLLTGPEPSGARIRVPHGRDLDRPCARCCAACRWPHQARQRESCHHHAWPDQPAGALLLPARQRHLPGPAHVLLLHLRHGRGLPAARLPGGQRPAR